MRIRTIGPNQTEIASGENVIFFSYNTPVAAFVSGKGTFRTEKFHSRTTTGHINKWLVGYRGYPPQNVETMPQKFFDNLLEEKNGQTCLL